MAADHLIRRNGTFYYWRRIPKQFRDVDPRTFVSISTKTGDHRQAAIVAGRYEAELEAYWRALKRGDSEGAEERYLGAIERARLEGFEYRAATDLATASIEELRARLERLEELYPAYLAGKPNNGPSEGAGVASLLGGAIMPELTLSKAFDRFVELTRERVRKKSPDQVRRWKATRLNAVANLIDQVGDKPIEHVVRADALAFRSWWVDRVMEEGKTPNSANKNIGHLAQIFDVLSTALELKLGKVFADLHLKEDSKGQRASFSVEELRALAEPRQMAAINPEARGIVLAMIETGMRPIELCNVRPEEIRLADDIPHVQVRPADDRELKTPYSRRDIPLVGVSLWAFQQNPNGFPRYRDRSSQLSALVNKALVVRGLLPSERHSLYSIRHSFKDRLIAVDMQDRMQDELMGHKNPRPVYGAGPTLAHKREWLLKIAITETPRNDPLQPTLL